MGCPEENVIVDFVRGGLDAKASTRLEEHLDGCPACAQVVTGLAMLEGPSSPSDADPTQHSIASGSQARPRIKLPPPLRQGDKLGRYVVLDRIGAGGMGVVYSAYDPELDRKVAIKLLLVSPGGSLPNELQEQRTRLMREAQAMAKLSHTNVITVHDVGELDGQVFVAMEFIGGPTLKKWMAQGPHPYGQVLEVFLGAGRGLAAAHAAGLVHRDFKPDNVLLSHATDAKLGTPRVVVTDFGLARPAAGRTGAFTAVGVAERSPVLSAQLTQTGELVGTPAYMAPEQLNGERSDALGDQFSFCVALYEALYGERPFAGDRLGELMGNVSSGNIRPLRREASVPRWVRRAIVQGLSTDPKARHRDMESLLAALQHDPSRRWRIWTAALVPTALLGVGLWAWRSGEHGTDGYCGQRQQQLGSVWTAHKAGAIRDGFLASGKPFAEDAWNRTHQRIEQYTDAWTERQQDACEAQRQGSQPQSVLALRMSCLQRQRDHLVEVLDVLSDAGQTTVGRATEVVATLPDPAICDDVERITLRVRGLSEASGGEGRIEMDRLLARARVLKAGGDYQHAHEVALDSLALAQERSDRFIEAEALTVLGDIEDAMGQRDSARRRYRDALAAAIASEHAREIIRAAVGMMWVAGHAGGSLDEARWWHSVGQAAVARAESDPELRAQLQSGLAFALLEHDELADAETSLREALRIREQAFGPSHPSRGSPLSSLGRVLARRGRFEDAVEVFEQAREAIEAEYGPHHPNLAATLDNLGAISSEAGRHEDAIRFHQRAQEIREAAVGPDHVVNGHSHYNLSAALRHLGRLEEAMTHARRAVAIYAANPDYARDRGLALVKLGNLERMLEQPEQAIETLAEAARVYEAQLGEVDPLTIEARMHMAASMIEADRGDDARALAAATVRRLAAADEIAPDRVAQARVEQARILARTGAAGRELERVLDPVLGDNRVDEEIRTEARAVLEQRDADDQRMP